MGGAESVAALEVLAVTAECSGPNGAYSSSVHWQRSGQTLLQQSDATGQRLLLALGERAWELDPEAAGERTALPGGAADMVHGHAFHPTLFELDRRFHDHRAVGTGEDGCLRLEMVDGGGRAAAVCLDPETMLPARFSFTPAGPGAEIELRLTGWRKIGELLYFTAFDLRQGEEEYRWVYSTIEPNPAEPERQSASGVRSSSGAWQPGERISLSLKDADLAEVLRSFARLAGFNLVLDPAVRGRVTVELQDVPWEQALEVILRTHGLAAEIDGSAWRLQPR